MLPISIATGNRHNNLFTGNAFRARTAVEGWAGMRSTVVVDGARDALKWTTRAEDDVSPKDGEIDSAPIGIYYPNFFTTGPGGHLGAGAKLKLSFIAECDASTLDTSMELGWFYLGGLSQVTASHVMAKNPTTNAKAQYYEFIWTYEADTTAFYIAMKDNYTTAEDADAGIDATTGELDNCYMWNFECYQL